MSGEFIEAEGVVLEFSHDIATVECVIAGQKRRVRAKRNGKMAQGRVYLLPGDHVKLEIGLYDLSMGRVVYRTKREAA